MVTGIIIKRVLLCALERRAHSGLSGGALGLVVWDL
jgi:hypothetical protein